MPNILITGASGQIGSELTMALINRYGKSAILATDIRPNSNCPCAFELLNVMDRERMDALVKSYKIDHIYHLAAILSAKGEANPVGTWELNMNSWLNVLEIAKDHQLERVFFPSSIAVFGQSSELDPAPQHGPLTPSTVYGMSKVAGEIWSKYYAEKYGVDVRSLRFPGLIGHGNAPGGGTTDYAVDIFHAAIKHKKYTCFLSADTRLPMLFMEDAIQGILQLMEAPIGKLQTALSYNMGGINFTPAELAVEIQKHIPDFVIDYAPDFRQGIADTWPKRLADQDAQKDWNWSPKYGLQELVNVMIENISAQHPQTTSN